jgi:hypothetical protein
MKASKEKSNRLGGQISYFLNAGESVYSIAAYYGDYGIPKIYLY